MIQLWSLSQEDPLEEGIAAHAKILAWRILWTEKPDRLQFLELQRVRYDWSDRAHGHRTSSNNIAPHLSFFSSHVWMWELDYKESWAQRNWCFWTVMLEKTLESPLDCQEIQPVHPKGDQSWVFIGRTDVEAETPILWPPDAKSWLIWKDPGAGKDWERDSREWDGWMASLTQWTWVWVNFRSWWWTGRPGVLRFMGL